MDPQSVAFTPRDDIWKFHAEMLRVQQTQVDHAQRLDRLERRHDEDARVKSVWGNPSGFPSVLSGTPQQVALHQPSHEPFSNFDDNHSNLIGSLQLDADDEPRRTGTTSRANSVRFDESANQGHWAHASRSSIDLIPRTGSGLGGHLMTERSYSHKSDGRQSSAGHSVHSATSGRANSLGLDTAFGLSNPGTSPLDPPGLAPGLFILGSVPAIIRCWLNTNFKHDSLLYAAICSGSYTSWLDLRLIDRLGFQDQIFQDDDGTRKIKLAVYLPEAIPHPTSSRSNSPAPQLPSVTVDFSVVDRNDAEPDSKAIQIFLGSDMLRAHNTDILLSTNTMTLFDDDRSKLSIPLVRPEDDRTFKSLSITSAQVNHPQQQNETVEMEAPSASEAQSVPVPSTHVSDTQQTLKASKELNGSVPTAASDDGNSTSSTGRRSLEQRPCLNLLTSRHESKESPGSSPIPSAVSRSGSSPAIWSNWRREGDKASNMDWANASKNPTSTYQRRDTGIKILKPAKPGMRVSSVNASHSASTSTGQSRFFDDGKRRESTETADPQLKRTASGEKSSTSTKENQPVVTKTRSANPVGGASAFAWLNSSGHVK